MLVSVCITTYNHEKYIAECIDSVLSQKVDFPMEILIGEDESSDQTRRICQKYADKYKDSIRLFLRKRDDVFYYRNKPTGRSNLIKTLQEARGKYIAKVDGDDCYIDSLKIQKQVEIMESNEEVAMVFTNAECLDLINHERFLKHKTPIEEQMTFEDLLARNPIVSSTVLFRKSAMQIHPVIWSVSVADFILFFFIAQSGKLQYLKDVTTQYRLHSGGVHSGISYFERVCGRAEYWRLLREHVPDRLRHIVDANIAKNHFIAAPRSLIYQRDPVGAIVHLSAACRAQLRCIGNQSRLFQSSQ